MRSPKTSGKSVGADGYIVKGEFAQNEFLAQVARLVARSVGGAGSAAEDRAEGAPA